MGIRRVTKEWKKGRWLRVACALLVAVVWMWQLGARVLYLLHSSVAAAAAAAAPATPAAGTALHALAPVAQVHVLSCVLLLLWLLLLLFQVCSMLVPQEPAVTRCTLAPAPAWAPQLGLHELGKMLDLTWELLHASHEAKLSAWAGLMAAS